MKNLSISNALEIFKILASDQYSILWKLVEDFTVNGHEVRVQDTTQWNHVIIDNVLVPIGGKTTIHIPAGTDNSGRTVFNKFEPIEYAEYILRK